MNLPYEVRSPPKFAYFKSSRRTRSSQVVLEVRKSKQKLAGRKSNHREFRVESFLEVRRSKLSEVKGLEPSNDFSGLKTQASQNVISALKKKENTKEIIRI